MVSVTLHAFTLLPQLLIMCDHGTPEPNLQVRGSIFLIPIHFSVHEGAFPAKVLGNSAPGAV
jgi:hypothetical protein